MKFLKKPLYYISAFLIVISILVLKFCQFQKPIRAAYFWKTTFNISNSEQKAIQELKIKKLYVKFFDVDMHPQFNFAVPVGVLKIKSNVPENVEIVPVVYIRNGVFKAKSIDNSKLPQCVFKLISSISARLKQENFKEVQIDCDWTSMSKDAYFSFLKAFKTNVGARKLSVTLRLHQFSNQESLGIPPTDAVSLMCYNLNTVSNANQDKNSILDQEILETYFQKHQSYPLQLNIALPIFSWTVLFHNQKPIGIDYEINEETIRNFPVQKLKNGRYKVFSGFDIKGKLIAKDDELKIEKTTSNQVEKASKYIHNTLSKTPNEIIIFDLNERYINKNFSSNEIENIYRTFDSYFAVY